LGIAAACVCRPNAFVVTQPTVSKQCEDKAHGQLFCLLCVLCFVIK